jgi:hypothetical protein
MRSVVMCLAVLGVLWLCGLASSGGTGLGVGAIGAGIAVVFGALGAIYDFSPTVLWLCLGFFGLIVAGVTLSNVIGGRARDTQRMFNSAQRRQLSKLCGGRCEHKSWLWGRCRGPAEHADHIYPWSRGGSTTLGNGQMLCAWHNLTKGALIPSTLYIVRLERRRERYYPLDVNPRVEWRIGVPQPPDRRRTGPKRDRLRAR